MAKKVRIKSGITFPSLKEAMEHFDAVRKSTDIGTMLSEPARSDVLDIYVRYCNATDYKVRDAVDITTEFDNRKRHGGTYATTKAFAVVLLSGEREIFSMRTALKEIAE